MTAPQGWTRLLLAGLGQLLEDEGAGDWHPEGIYTPTQTAITLSGLPSAPERAISIATYGLGQAGDDIDQTDSSVLVQFRMRGGPDPRVADDLADAVFNAVHGLAEYRLSTGVFVLLAERRIVAPHTRDGSGRVERADSYELRCHRPSTHRP
ncbi:minor capsid protein [Streptosporangium sp. NPDC049248]|uniref:minor capsid protein n=1 Tax=Streptosporangium sp. NPDC049248 TaxID=3155651 RepID=UPI003416B92A